MTTGAESVFAHLVHNAQHMGALKYLLSEQISVKIKWESQLHQLVLYTAKFKVCGHRLQNPGLEEISNQQEEQDAGSASLHQSPGHTEVAKFIKCIHGKVYGREPRLGAGHQPCKGLGIRHLNHRSVILQLSGFVQIIYFSQLQHFYLENEVLPASQDGSEDQRS